METDERYIELHFGKKAPFKVPEGYLDNLTQSIISNVEAVGKEAVPAASASVKSAAPTVGWWQRYRRYVVAAACVAFVVGGVSVWQAQSSTEADKAHVATATHNSSYDASAYGSVSDEEINYSMLDNEDMYSLMASN